MLGKPIKKYYYALISAIIKLIKSVFRRESFTEPINETKSLQSLRKKQIIKTNENKKK